MPERHTLGHERREVAHRHRQRQQHPARFYPQPLPLQSAFWTMPIIDIRTPRVTMPGAKTRRSRPPIPRARPRSMRPSPAKHARPTHVWGGLIESGWLTLPETRIDADASSRQTIRRKEDEAGRFNYRRSSSARTSSKARRACMAPSSSSGLPWKTASW